MPHARIPVEFIREHFTAIPDKDRPKAIALYLGLVLTSSELLLDGDLPEEVVLAIAHKIGISRGRYQRREVRKLGTSMASNGLLEMLPDGTYRLTDWQVFHSGSAAVNDARKQDAERKRRSRQQPAIPGVFDNARRDRPENVQPGHGPDTRAHVRRRQRQEELVRGEGLLRAETAVDQERATPTRPPLPESKQRLVLDLLNTIGDDAQAEENGNPPTIAVLNSLAADLPEGSLAKVLESAIRARDRRPKIRNLAGYVVNALQDERATAATLPPSGPHGTPRTT